MFHNESEPGHKVGVFVCVSLCVCVFAVTLPGSKHRVGLPESDRECWCKARGLSKTGSLAAARLNMNQEEDPWPRRLAKRREAVAAVQRSEPFLRVRDAGLSPWLPPDASSREITKREWEKAMQLWRQCLQRQVDGLGE
jgi:hypothetical protein